MVVYLADLSYGLARSYRDHGAFYGRVIHNIFVGCNMHAIRLLRWAARSVSDPIAENKLEGSAEPEPIKTTHVLQLLLLSGIRFDSLAIYKRYPAVYG